MARIPKIYLETTMFNFPFADDAPQYRADTLKLFEEIKAGKFQPFTSEYATDELQADTDPEEREKMFKLIAEHEIKILPKSEKAERLAETYIREKAVKATYPMDATHIAIAAVNELDFIVSLNFQHIVKRTTIEKTALINAREGYKPIRIYQPKEVIDDDESE